MRILSDFCLHNFIAKHLYNCQSVHSICQQVGLEAGWTSCQLAGATATEHWHYIGVARLASSLSYRPAATATTINNIDKAVIPSNTDQSSLIDSQQLGKFENLKHIDEEKVRQSKKNPIIFLELQ